MSDVPVDIRRFEMLSILSVLVGLVHGFVGLRDGLFDLILGAGIAIALTLTISRGRKNWARFVMLGMVVLGAAFMVWDQGYLEHPYPVITVVVSFMQLLATALLFTPQSARWLRQQASAV